jgi:hypothetical protein
MTPFHLDPPTELGLPASALHALDDLVLADQYRLEQPGHPYDTPAIKQSRAEIRLVLQRLEASRAAREIVADARETISHLIRRNQADPPAIRGVLNSAWRRMRDVGCDIAHYRLLNDLAKEYL